MQAEQLTQSTDQLEGCSPILSRILRRRGITQPQELDLRLTHLLPAQQLSGLEQALDLLDEVASQRQRVLVIGDFDCDGATSTALVVQVLRQVGVSVHYLVPDRFRFGYGLTPELVNHALAHFEFELILTVDNGISSVDGVKQAQAHGKKVLITDHHLTSRQLPSADAIINPNQPGCQFESKALAGVGVAFYLMAAWMSRRRSQGLSAINMTQYLDLVALGTVADVAKLDRNNRILVQAGLLRIRRRQCAPGILALLEVARRAPEQITAMDLGFILGPRINAAGRMAHMHTGIECLLAADQAQALALASALNELNAQRRQTEKQMQQEAMQLLETMDLNQVPEAIALYRPDWHQGVIGIVAGRLKERFYRPTIVFAPATDGSDIIKGSARSIPGVHIRDAIESIADQHPGLITHFGGHAMAAGLSLPEAHFSKFANAFEQLIQQQAYQQPSLLHPQMETDGPLPAEAFSLQLVEEIAQAGPWGQGFPEPCFEDEFEVLEQRLLQEQHLRLTLRHPSGGMWLQAIAFNIDQAVWPDPTIKRVKAIYQLQDNRYQGESRLQLLIQHLEPLGVA